MKTFIDPNSTQSYVYQLARAVIAGQHEFIVDQLDLHLLCEQLASTPGASYHLANPTHIWALGQAAEQCARQLQKPELYDLSKATTPAEAHAMFQAKMDAAGIIREWDRGATSLQEMQEHLKRGTSACGVDQNPTLREIREFYHKSLYSYVVKLPGLPHLILVHARSESQDNSDK